MTNFISFSKHCTMWPWDEFGGLFIPRKIGNCLERFPLVNNVSHCRMMDFSLSGNHPITLHFYSCAPVADDYVIRNAWLLLTHLISMEVVTHTFDVLASFLINKQWHKVIYHALLFIWGCIWTILRPAKNQMIFIVLTHKTLN